MAICLGIDLMGNDNKPEDILKAIIDFKKNQKQKTDFVFFATKDLKPIFKSLEKKFNLSLNFVFTQHAISMDENPLSAIRRKKDSTIFKGMHYLKENKIDAFISSGNTGAITVGASMILHTLKDISRPALLALIPTKENLTAILDVGASITFSSKTLVEFADLGAAFQKARNIKNPNIGLLNIGSEQKKGPHSHQKANLELSKTNLNFVGNIEGKKVFEGKVDVLVTDGFTGNIFLKTSEGLASFVLDKIYQNISKEERRSEIINILKELKKRLYYGEYPGALLIGIEKIVIKCHGYSSIKGIISAIEGTIEFVKNDIISSIKKYLK
jgi:glycerol-3-phosphate acyltransferase PlsX